jgi:hypothetical protein
LESAIKEVATMSSTAIVFHIVPGMTPKVIDFVREALGPRLAEHEESRRRLGITLEKAWIETSNEGDILVFYFEGDDMDTAMSMLGESDHAYDLWFREKMFALTGADLCDFRLVSPSSLVFEAPGRLSEGTVASVATAFPVLPGRDEDLIKLLDELSGPRRQEYIEYMGRYGLIGERFYLERRPDGEKVVLYAEGDDPAGAISVFARSSHPFDVWLREEMLYINGIDFIRRQTAPPPHLVLDWQVGVRAKAA